jgi:hypothetical protein
MNQINLYFSIEGDSIINTDRKRKEVHDVYINGEMIEEGDKKVKWDVLNNEEGEIKIRMRGVDTFTNKSYMIIYDLVLKDI